MNAMMSNLSAEGQLQEFLKEYGTVQCVRWIQSKLTALEAAKKPHRREAAKLRTQRKRDRDRTEIEQLKAELAKAKAQFHLREAN